jgi:threonine aldolase
VGDAQVIEKARWARKLLGGAMRQAGIVAAAGLYALEHWRERVDEDHRTAKALAAGLRQVPGMTVDRADVETNMFYVDLDADAIPPALLVAGLRERGVLVSLPRGGSRHFRFVTHYGITDADIPVALHAIGEVLAGQPVVAG